MGSCDKLLEDVSPAAAVAAMTSSVASLLDDTTPSDSGIQLLDSESSGGLNESMISSAGGFDFAAELQNNNKMALDSPTKEEEELGKFVEIDIQKGEKEEFVPVATAEEVEQAISQVPDEMVSSTCSTFDTENIVYRRRAKKVVPNKTPKKRVSFHEDILKNTKTDNIHIEHGFITYKSGACKSKQQIGGKGGRYSWCTEYGGDDDGFDLGDEESGENRQYVYRNACSDVLDYGKTDVFENIEDEKNYVKYDNSGVFEYGPPTAAEHQQQQQRKDFYKCACSDSNSSLDSGSSNEGGAAAAANYKQGKSNSCECIGGGQQNNNNVISDNCYYSEPNIEHLDEFNGNGAAAVGGEKVVKSVWSKEKKPKSSCLKKTKRNMMVTNVVVPEYDLTKRVKKFNVHHRSVIDNSKMIFGSLKDIFGISLPERGVPEGSEDVSTVRECIPESNEPMIDDFTVVQKPKNFLSKSLDGGFGGGGAKPKGTVKKYVHNVDEQLRRKNDEDLYAPSRKNSVEEEEEKSQQQQQEEVQKPSELPLAEQQPKPAYRNKYIINGESTVFEHTGVSYCYEEEEGKSLATDDDGIINTPKELPIGESTTSGSFIGKTQIKKKLSNIFQKMNVIGSNATTPSPSAAQAPTPLPPVPLLSRSGGDGALEEPKVVDQQQSRMESSTISSCGSEHSSSVLSESRESRGGATPREPSRDLGGSPRSKNRHLASPMRKKSLTTRLDTRVRMSPDLFNPAAIGVGGRHHHLVNLADEFDDILTVTTSNDTDKDSTTDLVILDYPSTSSTPTPEAGGEVPAEKLVLPSSRRYIPMTASTSSASTSKSSLINRFLRNVTQKKILEATIKQNSFFQSKLSTERKLFESLVPKGVKALNRDLIEDLNAEIAMEIELSSSACQLDRIQLNEAHLDQGGYGLSLGEIKFDGGGVGVGEIPVDIFNGNRLHIFRNENEVLMKAFKLYNGYSREGYMTPVLVLLTDKTLYVTDQVRNRLCNKFVLPYSELDVILVGPYGNTVLLSNSARDMQQVLLAGGPYPADGLVSSLELCARRGGSVLPAIGQLTLDHLAPLQAFVRDNSNVSREDIWKYYAVVNVPAGTLGGEEEPLGPHIKGPLMHRRMSHAGFVDNWSAGYFLLKAGVLYLFGDASQKLPTWAVALAECQGARRSLNSGRPYCFELLLRTGALQLAAPDEYVASDWLQALVQAASGLFELQERRRTLGCTLIMTSNHLLTLREDFSGPLRRSTGGGQSSANSSLMLSPAKENVNPNAQLPTGASRKLSNSNVLDTSSEISSIRSTGSTPTRFNSDRRSNSTTSTPTKGGAAALNLQSPSRSYRPGSSIDGIIGGTGGDEKSHTNMSSFYGKNSGVEVLTCASIDEMSAVKIPAISSNWWCILEFECQEVRENSDDLVVFFSTSSEQERFLSMLESIWHSKKEDPFPASIMTSGDELYQHCSKLFLEINRSWEPLLTAALGYPQ
uniref:Putative pleckstrin similarity domain protein n=1 Tax=Culex tarsalis TaxID=7177 RepID=A0A1Q3FD37_CULTA